MLPRACEPLATPSWSLINTTDGRSTSTIRQRPSGASPVTAQQARYLKPHAKVVIGGERGHCFTTGSDTEIGEPA